MPGFHYEEVCTPKLWESKRFPEAIENFNAGMLDLQARGMVEGAFVHGTGESHIATPGHIETTVRSDLDVVIVPTSKAPETLLAIHRVAKDTYDRTGIEFETCCFTREQLETGDHNLDGSFRAFMQWRFEEVADGPLTIPIKDIRMQQLETLTNSHLGEHDLDDFFAQRFGIEQKLMRGVFHALPDDLDFILKRPFNIGRKVFDHFHYLGILPSEYGRPNLKRPGVRAMTHELLGPIDPQLAEMYDAVQGDDKRYNQLMAEVYENKITSEEYEQLLHETLVYEIPRTLEVAERFRDAYHAYCKRVEGGKRVAGYAITHHTPKVGRGSRDTQIDHVIEDEVPGEASLWYDREPI